jgi:hypothetical protein
MSLKEKIESLYIDHSIQDYNNLSFEKSDRLYDYIESYNDAIYDVIELIEKGED